MNAASDKPTNLQACSIVAFVISSFNLKLEKKKIKRHHPFLAKAKTGICKIANKLESRGSLIIGIKNPLPLLGRRNN